MNLNEDEIEPNDRDKDHFHAGGYN